MGMHHMGLPPPGAPGSLSVDELAMGLGIPGGHAGYGASATMGMGGMVPVPVHMANNGYPLSHAGGAGAYGPP